jgi:uncharacterized membrane protein
MTHNSWWQTLKRIIQHRRRNTREAQRALGLDGLMRIQTLVRQSELRHSGEIRVCVEAGLPMHYLLRGSLSRERAVTMFGKLKVWDTEHNNGVLIYLLLADRRIEIVADRGLNERVSASEWEVVAQALSKCIQGSQMAQGLELAIESIHQKLMQHFPLKPGEGHINELPDAVVVQP